MMRGSYAIADEPRPGGLAHLAVSPMWPLFAMMFGGAIVAWPWHMLNAHAIGSPTKNKELAIAACGIAGAFGLYYGIVALLDGGMFDKAAVPYFLIALTAWKLGISYWLFMVQGRTFQIYEYYGGRVRNGILVVIASAFLVDRVLPAKSIISIVLG